MKEQIADFTTYVVLDHESLGSPTGHLRALELYRDSVIRPALETLSSKIDELQKSEVDLAAFELLDFEPMYQDTVQGFLLAVQSMWERALRGMLAVRAKQLRMDEKYVSGIRRAVWFHDKVDDLHDAFQELVGISIKSFHAYPDLNVLQLIGNVLRHGDGPSAEKLHDSCPRLWVNWLPPGTHIEAGPFSTTVPADAPKHPSMSEMTTPGEVLEHLIHSVCCFWSDIEYLRCNSFRRRHPSTAEWMAKYVEERTAREGPTNWYISPGD
jgi:hypothetical protein